MMQSLVVKFHGHSVLRPYQARGIAFLLSSCHTAQNGGMHTQQMFLSCYSLGAFWRPAFQYAVPFEEKLKPGCICDAGGLGGALAVDTSEATIGGSVFIDNSAKSQGGALYQVCDATAHP